MLCSEFYYSTSSLKHSFNYLASGGTRVHDAINGGWLVASGIK